MINLLPPEQLRELRAARANTLLLRYNVLLAGVLLFIVAALVVTFFYLNTIQDVAIQTKHDNDAKVASYAKIDSEAKQFRSDLANAKTIMDKDATYSKTLLAIAKVLPKGVVFNTISLDAATFGTPITLALKAADENTAVSAKEAFSKSPMFSDVHFTSLTRDEQNKDGHPINANLSVIINKDAAK